MATLSDQLTDVRRRMRGREQVVAELVAGARAAMPIVTFLTGIPGIGKSTVLGLVAESARAEGVSVIELDCGAIEPTDVGVFDAVGRALGARPTSLAEVSAALDSAGSPLLVLLDSYERWRLIDTWVRRELVPALPAQARVIVASRYAPPGPWRYEPTWLRACRVVELGPLASDEAIAFLEAEGVAPEAALRINAIVRGHPLALALAVGALRDRSDATTEAAASEAVTQALADIFVGAVRDAELREALEAASVTRRTTLPLLEAQLGEPEAARDAYGRLARLPFVRENWDGLAVHEAVKQAGSSRLRASNPGRHRELRRAAWRHLKRETRGVGETELWRYTADILYLLENPALRSGFFPTSAESVVLEPAEASDLPALRAISDAQDGPEGTAILDAWFELCPQGVRVLRDREGAIVGFRLSGMVQEIDERLDAFDPLLAACRRDVAQSDEPELLAYFLRRWLDHRLGEDPSDVQALCWIECKSTYLKYRPNLGRVYLGMENVEQYQDVLRVFGFSEVAHAEATIGKKCVRLVGQRMGEESVDGWLARIVAVELGLDPAGLLDEASRELTVGGRQISLTPLEFELMRVLAECRGQAVSHADLVERVWGYRYTGASNVDAVVVRGLRAKLGEQASLIETVRGVGYRLRAD
ncbi:MAG: winged helix-turn-helix domain-containing protein [Dehalococcoidia bacterium]